MDKPQSLSLNKAFEDTVKVILDGVTNPTKIKEAVETKWIEERTTKKLSKPK